MGEVQQGLAGLLVRAPLRSVSEIFGCEGAGGGGEEGEEGKEREHAPRNKGWKLMTKHAVK